MGNFWKGIMGGGSGFMAGGPVGAGLGFLGGMLGGGADQRQTRNLRQLTGAEQGVWDQVLAQMKEMYAGGDQQYFDTLFNPMKTDITETFGRERGRRQNQFARTGGGLGSIMNSQMAEIGKQQGNALAGARSTAAQGSTNMFNSNIASLNNVYQGLLGGMGIGGSTDISSPNDWLSGSMAMGGQAMMSPFSYWNQNNMGGKVNDWLGDQVVGVFGA